MSLGLIGGFARKGDRGGLRWFQIILVGFLSNSEQFFWIEEKLERKVPINAEDKIQNTRVETSSGLLIIVEVSSIT